MQSKVLRCASPFPIKQLNTMYLYIFSTSATLPYIDKLLSAEFHSYWYILHMDHLTFHERRKVFIAEFCTIAGLIKPVLPHRFLNFQTSRPLVAPSPQCRAACIQTNSLTVKQWKFGIKGLYNQIPLNFAIRLNSICIWDAYLWAASQPMVLR